MNRALQIIIYLFKQLCVCVGMCKGGQIPVGPEEVISSISTGVTGGSEPPFLGVGKQTWFSGRVT